MIFNQQLTLISATLILFSLAQANFLETSTKKLLVDNDVKSLNLEQIAEQLICDKKNANNGKQLIGRISTIVKLADLFDNSNDDKNKLDPTCVQENKDSLKELKEIVTTNNDNVCSDGKVSLIENFHQKYTSTVESDVAIRKERNISNLTKPVEIFFIHYAMQVSTICKKNLINNLEWDLKDKITNDDYRLNNGADLDNIMFGIGKHFSAMNQVNSYDDIVMLWNIIDGSLLAKENSETLSGGLANQINDNNNDFEIDNETGERIKLYIKSKNPTSMVSLQQKCFKKFKPIYEKLILPIIRLADLGYSYTNNENFDKELKELKENSLVKRWYVLTQICETVLPIKFLTDESLNGEETVMITKEEANKLLANNPPEAAAASEGQRIEYEPTTNSLVGVDELTSIESLESDQILKSIQSNLTARERSVRRAVSRFAKSALSFIKDKTGKFFFSKKVTTDNKEANTNVGQDTKEDMHEFVTTSLENVDEEKLLSMKGAFGHHHHESKYHNEITRINHRVRPADVEAERIANEEQISHMHTKSISQILNGWWMSIKSIAPSRLAIFIVGMAICLILLAVILLTSGVVTIG